jgi:hypothetical protein
MTDQTTIKQETAPSDEDEGGAYDLALFMKQRCAGFAYLLENTSENVGFIERKEAEGITQIAKDIAEKAVELFERVQVEYRQSVEAKKEA